MPATLLSRSRERLASFVKRDARLYDLVLWIRGLTGLPRWGPLHEALARFTAEQEKPVTFLQLGANDGLWNDPVRYFAVWKGWSGVLVEPTEEAFGQLRRNYRRQGQRLRLKRAAVSVEGDGSATLYRVDPAFLPALPPLRRASLLRKSSFSRDHLESFLKAGERGQIVSESVPARSVQALWDRFGGEDVPDVLVMDLEGYEAVLLLEGEFAQWRPRLIVFESHHLGDLLARIRTRLEGFGYRCATVGPDTLAKLGTEQPAA